MVRWIDDIFGCWVCNLCKVVGCSCWYKFVASIPFGKLTWSTDDPVQSVVFLDMTVSIKKGRLATETYQKPMNLYLYLPPTSNHPPKMTKAIVYQLLKKYKNQNTDHENYLKYSVLLYRCHKMRGHQTQNLRKYFLSVNKGFTKKKPPRGRRTYSWPPLSPSLDPPSCISNTMHLTSKGDLCYNSTHSTAKLFKKTQSSTSQDLLLPTKKHQRPCDTNKAPSTFRTTGILHTKKDWILERRKNWPIFWPNLKIISKKWPNFKIISKKVTKMEKSQFFRPPLQH